MTRTPAIIMKKEAINNKPAPKNLLQLSAVRGYEKIRTASVQLTDSLAVRVAVIYGTANVRHFLEEQKLSGFDFIEVMTCPGGCIGGGGQPKHLETADDARKERIPLSVRFFQPSCILLLISVCCFIVL